MDTLTGLLQSNQTDNYCYSYDHCTFKYRPCQADVLHYDLRYNAAGAAWVLIASIIVFFMKAGFMLVEVSFARSVSERRNVIIIKHQDAFASAFGFFLLGFDLISRYASPQHIPIEFFGVTDPVLWFFKFTFASNAATIIGGCLITTKYKLRLPAAFISAFVISGILHPIVARIIWSDNCDSLSPYRFCRYPDTNNSCSFDCSDNLGLSDRLYVLDFAGAGAVHLVGGVAGLVLCLFVKFQDWRESRGRIPEERGQLTEGVEEEEEVEPEGFWEWMYPPGGGEETVSEAALGVIILWFCWFAFNCGSTESIEVGRSMSKPSREYPYYGIPAVIAVNMIMAVAAGGTTAILIAIWAQVRYRTESVNASEIANGILSALVAITAGCAFMDYWGACLTGVIAVLLYHCGCLLEYLLKIKDTARVIPVHGVCGLWALIAVAIFQVGEKADCNLHAAFEGLCYCELRLPPLNWGERLLAQIIAAVIIIGISAAGTFLMYGFLYVIPVKPFVWVFERIFFLNPRGRDAPPLRYQGGWLLTSPVEDFRLRRVGELRPPIQPDLESESSIRKRAVGGNVQPATWTHRSDLGSRSYGSLDGKTSGPTISMSTNSANDSHEEDGRGYRRPHPSASRSSNLEVKADVHALGREEGETESDERL